MQSCLIIAHRGANCYAPQNTMPAFERAAALGVDGYETDVHLTRDGVPVICHNYTVNETSNGIGTIASYDLADLKKLDFGSYYSPDFRGTTLPTLDEFLDHCAKTDLRVINIELKSPKAKETDIVDKTLAAVRSHGLSDRLLISSFDPKLLIEAKRIDPSCRTGFLYSPEKWITQKMWLRPISFARSIGADCLHPMHNYVCRAYVKAAHKAGIKVNVWTIDRPGLIRRMLADGVDGIITNCPDRVRSIMRES